MPREGSGVIIVITPLPLASRERSRQEDSHSGRVRTLGKRVKGNLSRVQIPHPPHLNSSRSLWTTFVAEFRFMSSSGMANHKFKTFILIVTLLLPNKAVASEGSVKKG